MLPLSLYWVTAQQVQTGRRRNQLLSFSFVAEHDLLPGLDFIWSVLVSSFPLNDAMNHLFKHALFLKMLCYYSPFSLIVYVVVIAKLLPTASFTLPPSLFALFCKAGALFFRNSNSPIIKKRSKGYHSNISLQSQPDNCTGVCFSVLVPCLH